MKLRPGQKLHSAVCDAQVVVVRAPDVDVDLGCGGAPLLEDGQDAPAGVELDPSLGDGPLLGKRYADEDLGLDEDNFGFITLGVNQYYAGHAAKATADVVLSLEDTDPDATGLGILPNTLTGQLGDAENPEVTLRLQFQLLF